MCAATAIKRVFGLDLSRGSPVQEELSFNLVLFRFMCLTRARVFPVVAAAVIAAINVSVSSMSAKIDTMRGCELDTSAVSRGEMNISDSSCVVSYLFNGFHFMHIATLLFFVLVIFNGVHYASTDIRGETAPRSLVLQWLLFIVLLPLTTTTLAGFELLSHAGDNSMRSFLSMRVANSICMVSLSVFGFMGFCEIRGGHILLSTCVLLLHYFAMSMLHFAGVQVYPNFFYAYHDVRTVALALLALHVLLHCVWYVIQRYKIRAALGSVWLPVEATTTGLVSELPRVYPPAV